MDVLEILKGLLFLLPEIAVLIGCIYYVANIKTIDGVLMLVGSIIGIVVALFWRVVMPLLNYFSGYEGITGRMSFYTILSVVGFIGSVFFTIGVILLLTKVVKQKKESDSPFNQKF